ncbi:hypothetical protein TNCV_4953291 [Trichonephila clavipes]|nr:hypothetical protein TNCV_4953291 [Trichonephila clavipes]
MKTSSVEFISRSPTPSPMERNYRRFVLLRRIFLSLGSGNEGKREIVLNRRPELYRGKYRCILLWYPWKGKKEYVPLRTAYSQDSRYGMQPKARQSSRAGAAKTRTKTFELVEEKQKLLNIRERKENARGARAGVTF